MKEYENPVIERMEKYGYMEESVIIAYCKNCKEKIYDSETYYEIGRYKYCSFCVTEHQKMFCRN